MKGDIRADHIPINKWTLLVLGMPMLTITEQSGIEEELETTDLPDKTRASGGNTLPVEFTAKIPMHHLEEQVAMELWFASCKDPVSPLYKKAATLIHKSISSRVLKTYSLIGMFPTKRKLPDLDMNNEGEYASVEWTFSADLPLPI